VTGGYEEGTLLDDTYKPIGPEKRRVMGGSSSAPNQTEVFAISQLLIALSKLAAA
jgi:hypothetical protein